MDKPNSFSASFVKVWKAITPNRVMIAGMVVAGAMLFFPPHRVESSWRRGEFYVRYYPIVDPVTGATIDWGRLAIQLTGLALVAGALYYAVSEDSKPSSV